jgi:hypothetical protein
VRLKKMAYGHKTEHRHRLRLRLRVRVRVRAQVVLYAPLPPHTKPQLSAYDRAQSRRWTETSRKGTLR